MPKNLVIPVFMFLMLASYGQKSTLFQNINFRAKELKHSLNKNGDSLILESNKTIYSVEIFNQDYEKVVKVDGNETKIPLNDTPIGRLVVQARMPNKRILMTLLRHEEIENISEESSIPIISKEDERYKRSITSLKATFKFNPKVIEQLASINNKKEQIIEVIVETPIESLIEENIVATSEEIIKPKAKPSRSISSMLNWKPKKPNMSEKVFWISYMINSGTSTRKTMKMVTHSEADNLIRKYKIESKTQQGKLNELIIWEIFDSNNFIKKQTEDPDYINSLASNFFDVTPYFTSKK